MGMKQSRKHGKRRRARGRPTLEDVEGLESKLLAVALSEFVQHGYGGTSMRRIVHVAGISKTTLYSRFSSKEQLFRAIMRQQIERLSAATSRSPHPVRLKLEKVLMAYANHMLEMSLSGDLLEVNRLIYGESHRFPELGSAAEERTELGVQQVAALIRDHARADRFPCSDPEGIAEAFIHMLRGWYVNVLLTNTKVPAAQREQWVARAVHALISGRRDW
jgi:TetR/AcrR family transcriptional regulator, mexJK operon transcriptional repressor